MKPFLPIAAGLLILAPCVPAEPVVPREADVCVYGGTASGVMAAVAASREGATVILVEPSRWLGGMTGGGIDHLDWGREAAVGGSTHKFLTEGLDDFADRKPGGNSTYSQTTRIGHSNRTYRERFLKLVEDHGIEVIYDHRLGKVQLTDTTIHSATRQDPAKLREVIRVSPGGSAIQAIWLDHAPVDRTGCPIPEPLAHNAVHIRARVFIDCSYEGDLLAMSGTNYTWGRESREQYGESLAGVRPNLWLYEIDPWLEEGDPGSGTIPFVQDRKIGPEGSADGLTMAYCFRYKFNRRGEGIAIPEPARYDPAEFELFRRAMRDGVDIYSARSFNRLGQPVIDTFKPRQADAGSRLRPRLPDTNLSRALMTTTIFGSSENYPNGDWATRASIWKFHQEFFCKLIHFLRTDPVVPAKLRAQARELTFDRGDFDETGGWPHQLYVREARRMISDYVVTQKDLEAKTAPKHSVGLASYGVDDWSYATVALDGKVALQGGEFSILYLDGGKQNGSYAIPYEAIVPRKRECSNLLVPVCCSASHIAMTSIRMEPVWMILGESAGVAAAMAVEEEFPVQDVPYGRLRHRLLKIGQKLDPLPPVE
ncbi:FAD-dependent oxidoreductase [Haloferula sp. A504]|uniref:FAD-dependent oxidoreductase n=1 Tax=Haloferula sp. A504 TaxID=3373601 RepID=UPI0031C1DF42|nr:FAD-dependent oxidoreductase [Verrucomicrobiaceae bacterium E54]